jgi:nicotinamide mononucleotide (NMN) deamidase PncC
VAEARKLYLARYENSKYWIDFEDFSFYRMDVIDAYYVGGFVTYSNALKSDTVGVPAEVLAAHGAVSAQVAMAMATGGRERTGADLAVAVTGIAGPDGGTPSKPTGRCGTGPRHPPPQRRGT